MRDDRHLFNGARRRRRARDDHVTRFMVRLEPSLVGGDDGGGARQSEDHLVTSVGDGAGRDGGGAVGGGAQRGEVEDVSEVGAGEPARRARERVEVDGSIELEFLAEAAEEAAPPADVGRRDVKDAVEAAGARERAVEERRLVVMGRQSENCAQSCARIAP